MSRRESPSKLAKLATELLRKAGYTATGRKRGDLNWAQLLFERRLVRVPMGGQPRKLTATG